MTLLRRALDLLVRPQVSMFVYEHAFGGSTGRAELLAGARLAAGKVNDAVGSAIRGEEEPLNELLANGALDSTLHTNLLEEATRSRSAGLVDIALAELGRQREQIEGEGQLLEPLLIVGAQRRHGIDHAMMHKQCIGSHLVVVGREPASLWHVQRQRDLLLEFGCSVHCTASFGDGKAMAAQRYTFESAVDGCDLVAGVDHQDRVRSEPLGFELVCINGMAGGGQFWRMAAHAAPGFW